MTLYTLVTNKCGQSKHTLKAAFVYIAVTAFCIIFNKIYAMFGHGVYSQHMSLMYLYPLVGGVLPFLILGLFVRQAENTKHYRLFYNCYNSGIATLTVASALNGIFEIAGTSSQYMIIFLLFGWSMLVAALAGYLLCFLF